MMVSTLQQNPYRPPTSQEGKNPYLTVLPPASLYGELPRSPFFERSFQVQQSKPLDGSNKEVREYSPFTIEVLPPPVLLDLEVNNQATKRIRLIQNAWGLQNNFFKYKSFVEQPDFQASLSEGLKKLEKFVASGIRSNTNSRKNDYAGLSASEQPAFADLRTAVDIAIQLARVMRTPPLTLLISPQSMGRQFNKIQQFSERTRYGYVFQAWGEDHPKISFSGITGGWYTGSLSPQDIQRDLLNQNRETRTTSGLQFASKRDSAAWQNLMNLFSIYTSNGYIYDNFGKSYANHFVGALAIRYDQWVYIGQMNNFNFGYEEAKPHGAMPFDFEFNVIAMYDVATLKTSVSRLTDPQQTRVSQSPSRVDVINQPPLPTTQAKPPEVANFGIPNQGTVSNGASSTIPRGTGGFRTPSQITEEAPTPQTRFSPFLGIDQRGFE